MRILSVATWSHPDREGGSFRCAFDLVRDLAAKGHEVVHVTGRVAGTPPEETIEGVRFVRFDLPTASRIGFYRDGIRAARTALARLGLDRFDRVVVHHLLAGRALLDVLPEKTPLVYVEYMAYGLEYLDKVRRDGGARLLEIPVVYPVLAAWERRLLRRADRVVVLSEFCRAIAERFGADPAKVSVVPGAVDIERFSPGDRAAARRRLAWPEDRRILLAVRRLDPRMGLENLVEAAARLPDDVLVLLAGRGPEEEALRARIRARGLGGRVRLVGFVPEDDLPDAYRAADLAVLPTRALEGFGLVAAEALACGTPAAGTPVGAIPEVVGPLDARLVLPGADAEGIAAGLGTLLEPGVLAEISGRARAYAEARFDPARLLRAWDGLLHDLRPRPPVSAHSRDETRPLVSILIVSHRTRAHVLDALDAVRRAPPRAAFEVLVLENGSGELAEADVAPFSFARLVVSERNIGFGGGNNLLARAARGTLLLLLNPDAAPAAGAVDRLVAAMEASPGAAGAAPLLVGADGAPERTFPRLPRSALETLRLRTSVRAFLGLPDEPVLAPGPVENASAAALMLRRAAFDAVGGFDEDFFLYWEDVDLCARLRRAGGTLHFVPEAAVGHRRSASYERGDVGVFLEGYRAWRTYLRKHFPGASTLPIRVAALGWETAKAALRPRLLPRIAPLARLLLGG